MKDKRIEEILKLIKTGYTTCDIANKLQISTHTVKSLLALYKNKKGIEFLFK